MCWRLSFSIVTLVFVIFGLLEVEALGRRLCRIGDGQVGAAAIDAATEIAARLHMLVRFGVSLLTGLCFWVFTAVCGLELHREWGVMAFILNFVPFIGSFVVILRCHPAAHPGSQPRSSNRSTPLSSYSSVSTSFSLSSAATSNHASSPPFMVLFALFFRSMLWA
jgi:hypothetical protein